MKPEWTRRSSAAIAVSFLGFFHSTIATKTPVNEDLFNTFLRYTHFSAAAYASECRNPPGSAEVVKFFDEKSTDTQAFVLRDDGAKEVILSFRGTSSIKDLATDFDQDLVPYVSAGVDCSECKAHKGFLGQWNSVEANITATIKEQPADYILTVTGHSMGASLAVLAASSLKGQGFNMTTYTYGQPRTGDAAFSDYIDALLPEDILFRVTHENDGVPQTVPTSAGYRHHKTEYWALDPPSAATTFKCEGDEPADCNNSVDGIGLGANGTGINAAHVKYFGISVGNPLNPGITECI